MNEKPATRGRLFAPASFLENSRVADMLRAETVGGMLLMLGRGHRAGLGELALVGGVRRPARLRGRPARRCTST